MLNPDFRDMLSAFDEAGAEFLVVGAYAMAAHGVLRATGDLDFWIRREPTNAIRVIQALAVFGAPDAGLCAEDLLEPGVVFQIGVEPSRIDILTSIDGLEFDDAWPNRLVARIEGLDVPILGLDDIIENKRAVGRTKDLADVEELEARARSSRD